MKKRKIAVIVGSKSDLPQCKLGLKILSAHEQDIEVVGVYAMSQHRNTLELQELLKRLVNIGVDVIITGAGWANHLTGCCDAFLRYMLQDDKIVVIGVAFEDMTSEKENVRDKHNQAAVLSMTEVPGTKVVFSAEGCAAYAGVAGFANACSFAINGDLPQIKLPDPKETWSGTLRESLEMAS